MVANKLDKLKKSEIENNLLQIMETLDLPDAVSVVPFSAEKGVGKDQLSGEILKSLEEQV